LQEAKLAAQGKIHGKTGTFSKPPHVVEGEKAIDYLKYVDQSAEAYRVYHRTPWDPTQWHDPKKETEEKNDVKEDDDPKIYNNKKPGSKLKSVTAPKVPVHKPM